MSAEAMAVQQAVVAALVADPVLMAAVSGVFDGLPVRAVLPWAGVDCGPVTDWSHKTGQGREVRVTISLWSDGAAASALHGLMAQAEKAMLGVDLAAGAMRVVSLVFLRSRIVRDADGPWLGMIEYRARILAE
ncbi:DUF3168 domain-containing protein [Aquisediminimonas sediminicola]|uniref:DUF3168 domain-containing protein n=1 Tax=Alteraquisediminimonas sediminicola TaxID=2676787 RepID=UPI001C8DE86D|nr:DUF3168 domain-containing protein [Aquisediminimonas sediminicola]